MHCWLAFGCGEIVIDVVVVVVVVSLGGTGDELADENADET